MESFHRTIFHDKFEAVSDLRESVFSRQIGLIQRAVVFVPRDLRLGCSSDLHVHDDTLALLHDLRLKSSTENGWENRFCGKRKS